VKAKTFRVTPKGNYLPYILQVRACRFGHMIQHNIFVINNIINLAFLVSASKCRIGSLRFLRICLCLKSQKFLAVYKPIVQSINPSPLSSSHLVQRFLHVSLLQVFSGHAAFTGAEMKIGQCVMGHGSNGAPFLMGHMGHGSLEVTHDPWRNNCAVPSILNVLITYRNIV